MPSFVDVEEISTGSASHCRHAPIEFVRLHAKTQILSGSPNIKAFPSQPSQNEVLSDSQESNRELDSVLSLTIECNFPSSKTVLRPSNAVSLYYEHPP